MHFRRAPSPRQYFARYAIRARPKLPDKVFRYLRTVIVTADIHRGLYSPASHKSAIPSVFNLPAFGQASPPIHPLTSSQGAVFLINSRQSDIRCGRSTEVDTAGFIPKVHPLSCRVPWRAITRSPWSSRPGHLCWFCGTVPRVCELEVFLGSVLLFICVAETTHFVSARNDDTRIFLKYLPHGNKANPITLKEYNTPSLHHIYSRSHGILTMCPSSSAFAILLGPTNPQMIFMAAETLAFRCAGFSPALRLLVPTFLLLYAPLWVTPSTSAHREHSPTDHHGNAVVIPQFR